LLTDNNIDIFASNVTDKILEHAKICIPFKTVTIRPYDVPWMTSDIRKMIRKRKRYYRTAKRTNDTYHWNIFRQFRNETVSAIRLAKDNYYNKLAEKLNSNSLTSKDWWTLLKSFIRPSSDQKINAILDNNTSELVFDETEIANILNLNFQNQTILDESKAPSCFPDLSFINPNQLQNLDLNVSEIKDILSSLNTHKACGPDGISNFILKECASSLASPLCLLFNQSLKQSRFPSSWKEANVCAVFKKGDTSLPCNYRPISLLNTLEKVFERAVFKHVFNFLRDSNFFTPLQSGFLPADSTVNQLTYLYNTFAKALDDGLEVRVVFFDISKAFDKVWHKGLLYKLRAAGIRGGLLEWFQDYLSNRCQRVVLPQAKSCWATIKAGVPQGSILGPLLFLVFINDIVSDIHCSIRLFADDTNLYIIVDDPNRAAESLQNDIDKISVWAKNWLVTFNPSKTVSLLFSKKRNPVQHPPLLMENQTIAQLADHKHLGVLLSHDCSWNAHIQLIKEKAWKRVHILRKLKFRLNRKSLETIYTSFIRPCIEYADVVWDNCLQADKEDLQKIQNEAGRIVSGATKLVSINELHNELGWESLSERRRKHKLCLFYKMCHNSTPSYLSELLPTKFGANSRHANNFHTLSSRSNTYFNSFLPSTIREWNKLPEPTKACRSLASFKRHLNSNIRSVPSHFYHGNRKLQVSLTRIRTKCSALNQHLFSKGISGSPLCVCGQPEDAKHFFLSCPLFQCPRTVLINNLSSVCPVSINTILYGDTTLSSELNCVIVDHVHRFIRDTRRFD
jgi:hypothetical protein